MALAVGAAPAQAATGDMVVVAGSGAYGNAGDGGHALDASFANVTDTAVDADGNLFILDSTYHVVRRVDAATGIVTRVAGTGFAGFGGDGGPATDAALFYPYGIAVDRGGNLFISDTYNRRIRRVDAATQVITTVAGDGTTAVFSLPMGLAVDVDDTLLVADRSGNSIFRVDPASGLVTRVAGSGIQGYTGDGGPAVNARLSYPQDVVSDGSGNLYIADAYNRSVRRVDAETGVIDTLVYLSRNRVQSVAVDGDGNLFLALIPSYGPTAFNLYTVVRLDTLGVMTTLWTSGNAPGLAIGDDTHLYVAGGLGRQLLLIEGVTVPLSAGRVGTNLPPVADAGPDRMEECLARLTSTVQLDGSGSYDPDGDSLSFLWNWGIGASGEVTPLANLPLGMNVVELTVDDGISGTGTDRAVVTVIDTVPPAVVLGPGLLFEANDIRGVYFDLAGSGLVDDVRESCGLDRVVVSPGSPYPLGTTPVRVEAVDMAGNLGSSEMNITVRDTTPPLLTVPDDLVDLPATGLLTVVDLGKAAATDLFGPVVITNDAPKDGFPVGLTTVTWTATDANGNRVTDTQNVMISYLFGGFLRPLGVASDDDHDKGRHEDRHEGRHDDRDRGHDLTFKAGRTLPVRFRLLFADGTPVPNAVARLEVTALNGAPLPVAVEDERHHDGDHKDRHGDHDRQVLDPSVFRYDAEDGVYRLNYRTHRSMVGMYRLSVVLEDGTSHDVEITLR
ncbi:MAG: HYR domain-containing protein [Nitrospirota bacterium]|nr:HYR domain-containing protein [Nitrospirota bacterium]